VHGFSYEFRNIQCLQYSATQNSCSPIHHQINLISQHSYNITTPHSFPLPTIICYFLYSVPGAHGLKAQSSLETYKTHGQYSQNNSVDDRSSPFHMEHKSYVTDDSESHNAAPLFIENCQEHQVQDSYLYIFLDIFSFPLTTSNGWLDTLPMVATRVIWEPL
jgi:hypothetical protein